ncbi:laccase domain-containing protein [Candidatus Dependentiae bacterium]|nr:MAG: laccase domain-containing protein [Candidatus Dependentiae bacterium]
MFIHNTNSVLIYFGDSSRGISFEEYRRAYTSKGKFIPEICNFLKSSFLIQECFFLRQTHSTNGLIISKETVRDLKPFLYEGDFLITDQPGLGIGILTADCLPIIIYDPTKHILGLAHAGWRGSLSGIAATVVQIIKKQYSCNPSLLQVFFGPAAKCCCYAIDDTFAHRLKGCKNYERFLNLKNNCYYFDLAYFNQVQLEQCGILPDAFCYDYNMCSICNNSFYSYRNQKEKAGRQITMAILK